MHIKREREREKDLTAPKHKGKAMTTQILKRNETKVNVTQETSKFSLIAVMTMASLVGIWALACLIGGLASSGTGNLVMGYITAVFGN
jgi:hypothetical protein